MKAIDILRRLQEQGVPFAYSHFAEGEAPQPPFAVYRVAGTSNVSADNVVYYPVNVIAIELYTDYKDPTTERKLEALLDESEIFYQKIEAWIEEEQLYQVFYEFEEEG